MDPIMGGPIAGGPWLRPDRYPVLGKCPYCERTNVPRVHIAQKTCGSESCKKKQGEVARQKRLAKRRGA